MLQGPHAYSPYQAYMTGNQVSASPGLHPNSNKPYVFFVIIRAIVPADLKYNFVFLLASAEFVRQPSLLSRLW